MQRFEIRRLNAKNRYLTGASVVFGHRGGDQQTQKPHTHSAEAGIKKRKLISIVTFTTTRPGAAKQIEKDQKKGESSAKATSNRQPSKYSALHSGFPAKPRRTQEKKKNPAERQFSISIIKQIVAFFRKINRYITRPKGLGNSEWKTSSLSTISQTTAGPFLQVALFEDTTEEAL